MDYNVSVIRGMFDFTIIWVVPVILFCLIGIGSFSAVLWMFRKRPVIKAIDRYGKEKD